MVNSEPGPVDRMHAQAASLLAGVSVHGDQQLAEVERDLVQMDVLLDEAIKKLCSSFMAIHHAVDQQQETLDDLLSAGLQAPEQAARLQALRDEISQHVGAAVTGLQFQDMTSQLIGRMVQHLAVLREVFAALNANGPAALQESGSAEMLAMLSRLNDRASVRSTVNQRHMESGDIELF